MSFVKTKKQAQQIHARRRAEERYDLQLTKDDRRDIVSRIRESLAAVDAAKREEKRASAGLAMRSLVASTSANYLGNQSNRVSEWEVPYEGKNLHVLYDKKRETLITCLPPVEKDEEESDGNV